MPRAYSASPFIPHLSVRLSNEPSGPFSIGATAAKTRSRAQGGAAWSRFARVLARPSLASHPAPEPAVAPAVRRRRTRPGLEVGRGNAGATPSTA